VPKTHSSKFRSPPKFSFPLAATGIGPAVLFEQRKTGYRHRAGCFV
jgi:hypothetical protein